MRLYTAEEAAEVLRLSKWTVWKYGREGKLRTVKFGRTVRYDLEGGRYEIQTDTGYEPVCEGRR
jgi:excisionase family DNA binding protein